MSNFLDKIPVSPIISFGNSSVPNGSTFGTNFSILQTGGFMEVYTLSGLTYTIPFGVTGTIEYSGNTIPIQFTKGSGSAFSPDVLTLNSDNISSGRRKLGMLVYVYETKKIYQYTIDNYDTLWNNATGGTGLGGNTVVISDYGTTVKNNSPAGIALINAWTSSTISGIGGYNDTNASWRVLQTGSSGGGTFTGGTVTGATNFTGGLTANTISATTIIATEYLNLPLTPFLPLSGGTVTGNTIFTSGLTANTIFATNYLNLPDNVTGKYLPLSGGTVTGNTIFTSGLTITASTDSVLDLHMKDDGLWAFRIYNDTYSSSSIGLASWVDNTGISFLGTETDKPLYVYNNAQYYQPTLIVSTSGVTIDTALTANSLTIIGDTLLSGLTATTISATTYQNLPSTPFLPLSGGTVTGNTIFTSGLTSNTISATTSEDGVPAIFAKQSNVDGNGVAIKAIGNGNNYAIESDGNGSNTSIYAYGADVGVKASGGDAGIYIVGGNSGISFQNGVFGRGILLPLSGESIGLEINSDLSATGDIISISKDSVRTFTVNHLGELTASTVNATTYYNLPSFTGGTVNGLTATTISATTYLNYPDTFVTGFTLTSNTVTLTQNRTDGYSSFTISLSAYTGSSSTSGAFLPLSGGTVTGGTIFTSGVTANTISATTYQNLPATPFLPLSGGTVSGATIFTNGLTANTISATTYYNLPKDIFVTGGTYNNGDATFTNNSGGTFTVTGFAVGGGGGQTFYLNLSQSQGGNRLLSTTASTASEQTSGVTISNGVTSTIASFQSQPLNISLIPGGIWSFYLHSYKQNNNASFDIFVELYKRTSGGTQTLLFTTDPAPVTTNSPNPSMQLSDGYFSGTPLSVSDSIVAVVRATNTGNQSHIITLVTEGSQHYSYVVSTIPTQQGLTCDTLSGCGIIQTIQTDVSNKLDKSGGTITGNLVINSGLTATTISATTYQNLPSTPFLPLSGGTVTGNTIFTSGLTANTVSATTISATTYNGYVPLDSFNPSYTGLLTGSGTTIVSGGSQNGVLDLRQTWNSSGATTTAIKLNVTESIVSTGTTNLMELQVGGVSKFTVSRIGLVTAGSSISSPSNMSAAAFYARTTIAGGQGFYNVVGTAASNTSGVLYDYYTGYPFSPTSGGANYSAFVYSGTVNQTGSASGITRGLHISPTISAATDFRAIETARGKVIFADNISASGGTNAGSLLDLQQTWNTSGTPTAVKLNVTDTVSNANSLLMDLQVTGNSKFSVNKSGGVSATTITATNYQNLPPSSNSSRIGPNVIFNDFYSNQLSGDFIATSINGGSVRITPVVSASTSHPGQITLRATATGGNPGSTGSGVFISPINAINPTSTGYGPMMVQPDWKFEVMFSPVYTGPSSATTSIVRFGFYDGLSSTADTINGVYFEYVGFSGNSSSSATTIYGKTSSGSTRSQTLTNYIIPYQTAATLSSTNWFRAVITINSLSLVTFELFDNSKTRVWTDTLSANIPLNQGLTFAIIGTSTMPTLYDMMTFDYILITTPTLNR